MSNVYRAVIIRFQTSRASDMRRERIRDWLNREITLEVSYRFHVQRQRTLLYCISRIPIPMQFEANEVAAVRIEIPRLIVNSFDLLDFIETQR